MKVIQINNVYGKGSTGRITQSIHEMLSEKGVDSVVLYGRGKKETAHGVYKVCSEPAAKLHNLITRFTGIMYGNCVISTSRLIKKLKEEKPDLVHLQCINGYFVNIYRLVEWLKKNNIPTVLTLHAEFMYTANCGHAYECTQWQIGCSSCKTWRKDTKSLFFNRTAGSFELMRSAFDGFNDLTVVSVSPWLQHRAEVSEILKDKRHITILNGINTNTFHKKERSEIREKYCKEDEKIILHVTSSFKDEPEHVKGGQYVLELAKMMDDVKFIIAGKHGELKDVPGNVEFIGEITDPADLADLYNAADVSLITSKRETFSLICAESMCCGTPVAGFYAGGPESIAISEFSRFSPFGDLNDLEQNVRELLVLDLDRERVSEAAIELYSDNNMKEHYFKEYENILCCNYQE